MRLLRWRLLWEYAKDFLLYSMLITLLSYFIYFITGIGALTALIWFKLITSVAGIFMHQNRKSLELAFYMNHGIGKKQLMATTVGVDLLVWLVGIIVLVRSTI